jgi:hypothetical protein
MRVLSDSLNCNFIKMHLVISSNNLTLYQVKLVNNHHVFHMPYYYYIFE